jgi:hypothetical protein
VNIVLRRTHSHVFVLLALLVLTGLSVVRAAAPAKAAVTLYDQINNEGTTAISSQDFETVNNAFDDEAADDFVVPGGNSWTVSEVDMHGAPFNGNVQPPTFNVVFYADAAGSPGAVVATRAGIVPTITAADNGHFNYALPVAPTVVLSPGTYWVSIVARLDFNGGGQWGWQIRTVQSGSPAKWRNPGGGFATACSAFATRTTCIPSSAGNPDQSFRIVGDAGTPTTTTVASSVNPSQSGQPVTFTATVCPSTGAVAPTGTVTFADGATPISGAVALTTAGATPPCALAQFTTSSLIIGTHSIVATYSGGGGFAGSSGSVAQTVTCASPITGNQGSVTLNNGSCLSGATVNGSVTIPAGSNAWISNSTIHGSIMANGPAKVGICGSTIDGSVSIANATGFVLVGADGLAACSGNLIKNSVTLSGNLAGLRLAGNTITNTASVNNNKASGTDPVTGGAAAIVVSHNTIGSALTCSGNTPPPSNAGVANTAGARGGQCAGAF